MRRALATATIAGAVALVPLTAVPASADDTQLAAGAAIASSENNNDDDGNDIGKWGLLGLLGLPGLFGYKKYKEHHASTNTGGTSRRV